MVLEEADMSVGEVMQVRNNSLKTNYEPHEAVQSDLEARLRSYGFEVEQHGDEAPDADEVFFGDGPDLCVLMNGDSVAYVEIKSKRYANGPHWFGRLNRRFFNEYVSFADTVDVPVYVYFALYDEEEELTRREAFVEITDETTYEGEVTDITEQDLVFHEDDSVQLSDTDIVRVPSEAILHLGSKTQLVAGYPNIHGNDVVEMDDDDFRSFRHFIHEVSSLP